MKMDLRFRTLFEGRVKQLYLYITDRCGLRCEQCLYKTTLANRQLEPDLAAEFIDMFGKWGARKLTFIGGEPLLYDYRNGNRALLDLSQYARTIGYEYIRVDTNGQHGAHSIINDSSRSVSNLAISLDGFDATTNDALRGAGTFERATATAREAIAAGIYVTITCCVHPLVIDRLPEMVQFAEELGVSELNFHPLFKMGIARDEFSGDTAINPRDWMFAYRQITAWSEEGSSRVILRAPERFVERSQYDSQPSRYHYCPTLMAERALIHPDGDIRICALCIGTDLAVARFDKVKNRINYVADQSELNLERARSEPCMSQTADFGDLVPLCISYKPHQNEYVWTQTRVDHVLGLV